MYVQTVIMSRLVWQKATRMGTRVMNYDSFSTRLPIWVQRFLTKLYLVWHKAIRIGTQVIKLIQLVLAQSHIYEYKGFYLARNKATRMVTHVMKLNQHKTTRMNFNSAQLILAQVYMYGYAVRIEFTNNNVQSVQHANYCSTPRYTAVLLQ